MISEIPSDSLLWNRFLEGDLNAYSKIYNRTVQDLFRYGMLYTSDQDLVKDCIHDVFVKIYTNRAKLSPTDNVIAYLTVALKNTLFNALKKNQIHFSLDEVNDLEELGEDMSTPESSYIDSEQELQTHRTVHSVMSQLTSRQREIIYYRYIKDMSIDEISLLTEMNHQSVSNVIQRSLVRIRTLFKKK